MNHTLTEQRPDECSKEPIMQLARPSSPRHQDVSCVLASVFGNLHSQEVLDDDTIINLETSRTHDPDFHDYYVQLLNQIRTERKERLEALEQVEQHMLSAYSLAQQQNLTLQQDNTQTALGIPERHVSIGSYLDNEILSKFNLLTPSSYLRPSPPSLSSPTVPDLPNFMTNTLVMEEHEKARNIKLNRDPVPRPQQKIKRSTLSAGHKKVVAPAKAAWRDSMNPDVRIEEQKGLEKLQAKSNFLKAKRFDNKEEETKEERIFCTVPSSLLFDSYEIGKMYEQKLKIKNVSTTSRQLKLLPPKTKYFTISKNSEMSKNGAIAPGLSIDITVLFMPESLGKFEDEIQILPQGGNLMSVNLVGERPPPYLSLPDTLDCGYSLVHGILRSQFRCSNNGGPGIFHLYPCGIVKEEFLFNDLPPPEFEFKDTCFTVTPTSFALKSGEQVVIDVEFRPTEVQRYTTEFTLAADNCTTRTIKLTAESQSCHVQVLAVSGGDSTVDYDIRRDCDSPISVKFEDQNPGTKEEKILILRNCVNVPLHYNWEICKELTEQKDGELISPDKVLLKGDPISPFQITPGVGILDPCTETSFVVSCLPEKAGKYSNISRLWIDDVPALTPSGVKLERFDGERIQLDHLTQPHNISLKPPAIIVPGESITGYVISKTVKVVNNSLSCANVTWSTPKSNLKFNIRPISFTVGAGSHRTVEIDLESESVGDQEAYVVCNIDNVEKPIKLFVKAKFRGPKITIETEYDDPVLDFGYIHYKEGCLVQRQFTLRNHDGVDAKWSVAEMEHCINSDYKKSEFMFSEQSGEIGPFGVKLLTVTFQPHCARSVKSFIECTVTNGVGSNIRVVAEVQEPKVVLQKSIIDLGVIYVNVPVMNSIVFESLNFTDCYYNISQVEGKDREFADIQFEEDSGKIYAGARQSLEFKFTGLHPTVVEDYTIGFEIEGTTKRLALGIRAVIKGLTILHETPSPEQLISSEPERTAEPFLDFGEVAILKPISRVLKIVNNTAIPTHFKLEIGNFRGDNSGSPPVIPLRYGSSKVTQKSSRASSHLLTKTPLLLDPSSRSKKQSDADYWKDQLKHDRGVCFIASPSSGYLPGNGVTIVTVYANSDMWGCYTDYIISSVGDLDPVRIPIKMKVVESPLFYKLSNNNKPTVRFGSYPINEAAVSRTVQISNQGPQDIRLDWKTYNVVPGDSTLIDFNMFIGDAFPVKSTNSPAISDCQDDLIRVQICAHDGQISSGPFRFQPDQCVIPARGTSKVNLLFDPRYGVGQCGGNFTSYALAYQSLDNHVDSESCTREGGEKVPPLRIHMTGKVEVPELIITAEEHGFTFKLMAGTICPGVNNHTKVHKIALLNSSKLHLQFEITAPPPFTLIDDKSSYTLIPRQKLKISHGFNLSTDLLNNLIESDKQHFFISKSQDGRFIGCEEGEVEVDVEEKILHRTHEVKVEGEIQTIVQQVPEKRFHIHSNIQLNYDNGHKQNIPVHARIILPTFYITPHAVHFGTCLVQQTTHLTVRLINPSNSPLRWESQFHGSSDEGTFAISPEEGSFETSDSVLINISFTPHTCKESQGVFSFRCTPGGRTMDLSVRGTGSHDEKMLKML